MSTTAINQNTPAATTDTGSQLAAENRSVEIDGATLVVRPIGPEPVTWPVALVCRADRRQPPAAKAFLKLMLESAESASAEAGEARIPRLAA